jgi:hypothetical protein
MTDVEGGNAMMDALTEAFLQHLETGSPVPELEDLPASMRHEAEELFGMLEAAWDSEVELPPIEEDPVAIALGFVAPSEPERTVLIAGQKVQTLRKKRSLNARQLLDATTALGGSLSLQNLVLLERQPLNDLSASDATALADALRCSVRSLSADPDNLDGFVAFLYSDAFDSAVAEWCETAHRNPRPVAIEARRKMLAGQRRGAGTGDVDDWLDLLRAVLELLL